MSKLIEKAKAKKTEGYTHMASIVKSHYASFYYNVNSIDEILRVGKWIPAPFSNGYRHGRIGSSIDWKTTCRK